MPGTSSPAFSGERRLWAALIAGGLLSALLHALSLALLLSSRSSAISETVDGSCAAVDSLGLSDVLQLSGSVLTISGDVRVRGSLVVEGAASLQGDALLQGHSLGAAVAAAADAADARNAAAAAAGAAAGAEAPPAPPPADRKFKKARRVNATEFLSTARVYTDVNAQLPREHWDYNAMDLEALSWGNLSDYKRGRRLGAGRYCTVFEARALADGSVCVVKLLKAIEERKVKREIRALQALQGGPNIVGLLGVVRDDEGAMGIVQERVRNVEYSRLYPQLDDADLRFYFYQLLKALNFTHSRGIMHRDIKPTNIMIDPRTHTLRLIDFGIAEFYHVGQALNVRVASRNYKPPELLVDLRDYDYALDMWGVGAVLAEAAFRLEAPLFAGMDTYAVLAKQAEVLGTDGLWAYLKRYGLTLDPHLQALLGSHPPKPWTEWVTPDNAETAVAEVLDLLSWLLRWEHSERLSAAEAMAHPYFEPVRQAEAAQEAAAAAAEGQAAAEDQAAAEGQAAAAAAAAAAAGAAAGEGEAGHAGRASGHAAEAADAAGAGRAAAAGSRADEL